MENNNNVKGIGIGFGVPSLNKDKHEDVIKEETLKKEEIEKAVEEAKTIGKVGKESDVKLVNYDEEYTDENYVTIMLVKNYNLYRKMNDKVLPKKQDYIGSSVQSSRTLSSNKGEVEAYFPNIIGLSPNDSSFVIRVKQYLNNIRIPVDELGRKFNISFHYFKYSDYARFKDKEDEIEMRYRNVDKTDLRKAKEALKEKINRLNALESTKYKYGYPINVDDYLMYRHCLLYNDVAKDTMFINADPSIRFYFKDDKKEAEKLRKYRNEINTAKVNYVNCLADTNLFKAVYIQYCVITNKPILISLAEPKLTQEVNLDKFSNDEAAKFNKICSNKNIKLISDIELLIAKGELIRSQYNQNISTPNGDFIGANMLEAVNWFNSPENGNIALALMNKLKFD